MATVKPLYFDSAGDPAGPREMATTDDVQLGALEIVGGGDITLTGGGTLTGLPSSPSAADEAASKEYVESVASGLDPKESCRLATAAALDAYTASGSGVGKYLEKSSNGALTVDGVSPDVGDRILVKDENSGGAHVDHGIYTVTAVGDGSNPWRLTRATDFDEDAEVTSGAHTWISEGTANEKTSWVVITPDPITVDTTAIEFTQFGGEGLYTGGDGIDIAADKTISVDLSTGAELFPGLQFGVAGDIGKLAVKPYNGVEVTTNGVGAKAYNGITVDANGIGVNAGDGLVANAGPGDLDIDLATGAELQPGLQFGTAADAGKIAVKPDPAGAIQVAAAGLKVNTDGSTIQINGSNQLEVLAASDAVKLKDTLTAQENLSQGDPVEWGTVNDRIRQSQASVGARVDCFAVVIESGGITSGNSGQVIRRGAAVGVLSGATPGSRYYVGRTGGLVQGIGSLLSGDHVIFVGTAINATDLEVRTQYITRLA